MQQQSDGYYVPSWQQMYGPSLDHAQAQAAMSQQAYADPRGPIQRNIGNFLSGMRNRMLARRLARQGGLTLQAHGAPQMTPDMTPDMKGGPNSKSIMQDYEARIPGTMEQNYAAAHQMQQMMGQVGHGMGAYQQQMQQQQMDPRMRQLGSPEQNQRVFQQVGQIGSGMPGMGNYMSRGRMRY